MIRRHALGSLAALLAGSPSVRGQKLVGEPPGRITPLKELVNVLEAEPMAQRKLSPEVFAEIGGGDDRAAFDRITLRPRLMVDTLKLDLSLELYGQKLFAPILVGPAAMAGRFHPDGEVALAGGASAGKALVVLPARSSQPLEKAAAAAGGGWWLQVDGSGNPDAARTRAMEAVKLGCKAVVATVGVKGWPQWDRFRRGLGAPVLLKGVATVPEARAAVERGADGIVVSTYGRGNTATVSVLADLVDAVGGKVPVLVDGGFRRGTDILKALAFGAKAVLVVRPPLWGLAAYGPDGVQQVLELLQGELARSMAMCGIVDLSKMDRAFLRVHRR